MKFKNRIVGLVAAGVMVAAGVVGTGAAAASATEVSPYGQCAYEYQGQCYTWVTDIYTCNYVFEAGITGWKYTACVVWNQTGLVTRVK